MEINIDAKRTSSFSESQNSSTNSANLTRHISCERQNSFIHESINSSLDFPAYIPWQSLSTSVNDQLRHKSVRINRSNCVEWAKPIQEENERVPLIDRRPESSSRASSKKSSMLDSHDGVSEAVQGSIDWKVCAFLLINCSLGAGVLNYPSAYDRVGGVVIATSVQLGLMTVLMSTMLILVYASDYNKDNTYHDVLLSMCGKRVQQLAAVSILLTCYGIGVAFLVIIGDQFDRIAASHLTECYWYIDRKVTITVVSIIFILPMCYFQRLDFLRYAGTLGVFSMIYVAIINVYEYIRRDTSDVVVRNGTESLLASIGTIPVFTFAYQSHEIIIPMYACMEERTLKCFSKAAGLALTVLFAIYSTAGICGYLTFGVNVSPDIMQLYDARQAFILVGIIALVIKMIATYPPMIFCGRGAIDGLYAEIVKLPADAFIAGEQRRRIIITTSWFFSSLLVALVTPNIGIVIELLGSLASANVFIFPSLCLIAIARRELKLKTWMRIVFYIFAVFLIAFGVTTFFLVMIQTYFDIQNGTKVTHEVLCK